MNMHDNRTGGSVIELFKRNRRRKQSKAGFRRGRRLPVKPLAPVEEIVEQGILVAEVAIRMSVKNTIIMNALKRGKAYDVAEIHELVRATTLELADERDRDAKHIQRIRDEIRKYGRSAWQETEYAADDMRTLKHRQEVYERMKVMLEERASDDAFVSTTASQARQAAWGEVGESLKERASHPYYAGGGSKEYQREREDRIERFIEEDLAALVNERAEGAEGDASRRFTWRRKRAKAAP